MIYADNNGTCPLKQSVKDYLIERFNGPFANPNAIHSLGKNVNDALEACRGICATALGAEPEQVIFTSGASESVSQIFHNITNNHGKVLTSQVEHAAVDKAANALRSKGIKKEIFPFHDFKPQVPSTNGYDLACLMYANNESGIVFDLTELQTWAEKSSIPFFSDTTQAIGKVPFNFKESKLDYAVVSAHKLGSMTGTGILLAKNPASLKPLIYGGGQENGLRGGTQNYLGIECLSLVLSTIDETLARFEKVNKAKLEFEKSLKDKIPGLVIFGDTQTRLPNTTLFAIPGIHGQAIQIELESKDIFVTTSSACSDNFPTAPMSLLALGYKDEIARGSVRVSSCENCTDVDYMKLHAAILDSYQTLNRIKV